MVPLHVIWSFVRGVSELKQRVHCSSVIDQIQNHSSVQDSAPCWRVMIGPEEKNLHGSYKNMEHKIQRSDRYTFPGDGFLLSKNIKYIDSIVNEFDAVCFYLENPS